MQLSRITNMKLPFLRRLDETKLFSEAEAWKLYKYSAYGEAIGWTLLIAGIVMEKFRLPGGTMSVAIAGSIHGTLFLAYFGILLAAYGSLGWSHARLVMATLASLPPYGTLVMERWAARRRSQAQQGSYRRIMVRGKIARGGTVLAWQTSDGLAWTLPGGYVAAGEPPQAALERVLREIFGVKAAVGTLEQAAAADRHPEDLELTYGITNPEAFAKVDLAAVLRRSAVDEIRYVPPQTLNDL